MMNILKLSAFFALCAMLVIGLVACGDDDVNSLFNGTITGTITIDPGDYDGSTDNKPYIVIVDNDDDPGNGFPAYVEGTFPAADSETFTIQNVPVGTYYVLAVIYAAGTEGPPIADDFFGVHGGTFIPIPGCSSFPAFANVVVTSGAGTQADITVYKQGTCI